MPYLNSKLKFEEIFPIGLLSFPISSYQRLALSKVPAIGNSEMRKKLEISICYLMKKAVTQGGGACPVE